MTAVRLVDVVIRKLPLKTTENRTRGRPASSAQHRILKVKRPHLDVLILLTLVTHARWAPLSVLKLRGDFRNFWDPPIRIRHDL